VALLKEYVDLFPQNFTEIKGIKGELGEMRIELKPDAKPIKRRSYRLNPRIKERVKEEINKMLAARLIFPMEESDWISPIVIQDKKTGAGGIRVCVDFQGFNAACIHDPFPTPFSDKSLYMWHHEINLLIN